MAIAVAVGSVLVAVQPPARADTSVDALLQDPALSEPSAQEIASTGTFTTSSYTQCPTQGSLAYPPSTSFVYKTVHVKNGSAPVDLYMDEYLPPAGTDGGATAFPVAVLIHGGGFWRGCRRSPNEDAG